MRVFRHFVVQRLLSVGLLLSLSLWLGVPAYAAQTTLAEELGLPGELESVLADALADAPTPEAFVERLAATLADGADAEALAEVLESEPDALLALLYGHLFQVLSHPDALRAVPTVTTTVSAGTSPAGKAAPVRAARLVHHAGDAQPVTGSLRVILPAALGTAAQPLGP